MCLLSGESWYTSIRLCCSSTRWTHIRKCRIMTCTECFATWDRTWSSSEYVWRMMTMLLKCLALWTFCSNWSKSCGRIRYRTYCSRSYQSTVLRLIVSRYDRMMHLRSLRSRVLVKTHECCTTKCRRTVWWTTSRRCLWKVLWMFSLRKDRSFKQLLIWKIHRAIRLRWLQGCTIEVLSSCCCWTRFTGGWASQRRASTGTSKPRRTTRPRRMQNGTSLRLCQ